MNTVVTKFSIGSSVYYVNGKPGYLPLNTLLVEGNTYIPLRAICEKLGFEVNWVAESRTVELVKLPLFITFSVDEDGYTFAKTAPMKLGSAPVIVNDRTYRLSGR